MHAQALFFICRPTCDDPWWIQDAARTLRTDGVGGCEWCVRETMGSGACSSHPPRGRAYQGLILPGCPILPERA